MRNKINVIALPCVLLLCVCLCVRRFSMYHHDSKRQCVNCMHRKWTVENFTFKRPTNRERGGERERRELCIDRCRNDMYCIYAINTIKRINVHIWTLKCNTLPSSVWHGAFIKMYTHLEYVCRVRRESSTFMRKSVVWTRSFNEIDFYASIFMFYEFCSRSQHYLFYICVYLCTPCTPHFHIGARSAFISHKITLFLQF